VVAVGPGRDGSEGDFPDAVFAFGHGGALGVVGDVAADEAHFGSVGGSVGGRVGGQEAEGEFAVRSDYGRDRGRRLGWTLLRGERGEEEKSDRDRIFGKNVVDQIKAMGINQVLSAPRCPR
jgi:hypothetical protein